MAGFRLARTGVAPADRDVPVDGPASGPVAPARVPVRARRRPAVLAAAVLAVCLGALVSWWAFSSASTAVAVIGVRRDVPRGAVIGQQDLVAVSVGVDPALRPVPAGEWASVVGRYAAVDLAAGGLLTRDAVATVVVPARGQSVVGVALAPGMRPASGLRVGDRVRIVTTPGAQASGDIPVSGAPDVVVAQVVGVGAPGVQDTVVVDVSVPEGGAAVLAARAATGRVALVLDSRER